MTSPKDKSTKQPNILRSKKEVKIQPTKHVVKVNIAETGDLNMSLNQEALHMMICSETEDHKNAAKAFVNKEKVVFKGK